MAHLDQVLGRACWRGKPARGKGLDFLGVYSSMCSFISRETGGDRGRSLMSQEKQGSQTMWSLVCHARVQTWSSNQDNPICKIIQTTCCVMGRIGTEETQNLLVTEEFCSMNHVTTKVLNYAMTIQNINNWFEHEMQSRSHVLYNCLLPNLIFLPYLKWRLIRRSNLL